MFVNYDLIKLQKAFKDFYNTSGLTISFRDANYAHYSTSEMEFHTSDFCKIVRNNEVTIKYCNASDQCAIKKCKQTKTKEIYLCHAGLIDIIVPLFYNDVYLGSLIFGQMRKNNDFSEVYNRISKYPLDFEELERCFYKLPNYDKDKIESIGNIAEMLAKHILLENILKPTHDPNIDTIIAFINDNLDKNLSIETITNAASISKSSLYRMFESNFHCTVNEYIMRKKIMKSIDMLYNLDLTIEQISQNLGFTNTTAYIRVFKKINGITPLQFRKQNMKHTFQI